MTSKYRENFLKENKSNNGWYHCGDCGKGVRGSKMDVDHIIPKNHGGSDSSWNLRATCQHCNRSKQDKLSGIPGAFFNKIFK